MAVMDATEVSPEERAVKDALKKITKLFESMSHPTRLRIIMHLDEHGASSPNKIRLALGESLGTVAYHVRILVKMRMIELKKETRVRGAVEHHYKLTTRGRRSVKLMKEWAIARAETGD